MCALFCRKPPRLRENEALRWVDGGSHTKQILKDYFSADNEVLFRTVIDVLLYSLGPLAVVAIATWQSSWFLCSASTLAHTLSLFLTHKHIFSPTLTHSLLLFLSLSSPSFSVMTHSSQVCTQHRLQMLFIEFWECSWEEKRNPQGLLSILLVYWAGLAGAFVEEPTLLASLDRARIHRDITLNYTAPHPLINTGSPSPSVWECGNTDWPCLHITRQNNTSYLSE